MRKVAILCDFDGTVARDDVGNLLFQKFADAERSRSVIRKWKEGLISSRECLEREAKLAHVSHEALDGCIEQRKLDPYFKDFVDFCTRRKYDLLIISDGLDYYIDAMLMKYGLGFIEFRANHLVLAGDRIAGVEFPWYDPEICPLCGNCKKRHVLEHRDAGRFTIYVGNGLSDRCASGHADLVFAKGELLDHCRQEKIDCLPWRTFRDVERDLTTRLLMSD